MTIVSIPDARIRYVLGQSEAQELRTVMRETITNRKSDEWIHEEFLRELARENHVKH